MPLMDGIEMIRKAKEEYECSFKSIILTSYADFGYAKKAIDLSVSAYLMKPVDEDELKEDVAKIISELERDHEFEQFAEKRISVDEMPEVFIKSDKENDYVQHVLDATKEHYAEKISIESFSDELGVSASYLSRKFKDATGTSFLDFLNKYRIQQAIRLLGEIAKERQVILLTGIYYGLVNHYLSNGMEFERNEMKERFLALYESIAH